MYRAGVNAAVTASGKVHAAMRVVLRWNLSQMLSVLKDCPALIAPRMAMVFQECVGVREFLLGLSLTCVSLPRGKLPGAGCRLNGPG